MPVAVIFTSQLVSPKPEVYAKVAAKISQLASEQPGYIAEHSCRDEQGYGVSVSYWETEEDALKWKEHPVHKGTQERGRNEWYAWYQVDVANIQRSYKHNK